MWSFAVIFKERKSMNLYKLIQIFGFNIEINFLSISAFFRQHVYLIFGRIERERKIEREKSTHTDTTYTCAHSNVPCVFD